MNSEKTQRIYKTIMLIVLAVFITFLVTTIYVTKTIESSGGTKYLMLPDDDIATTISRFRTLIDQKFLGNIDEEKLKQSTIKGYIQGLGDDYTEYFTKEELEQFYTQALGNYDGIGIYMAKDEASNAILVISPIKESPAYKSGILPGDIIVSVEGTSYTGDEITEASKAIKGKPGTMVKLEVYRDEKIMEFEVERASIKVKHVEGKVLSNNIGYLELATFDDGCSEEFLQKYNELKENNITSLVVDLRNNAGGIVDEALKIADYFLEKGTVTLVTRDRAGNKQEYKAKTSVVIDIPVVILINGNSASASEILAGALKDNERAHLIGTNSYGKGLIQELMTLSDGSGLKMTTSEYYTPKDTKINKIGIKPDEIVELPEDLKNRLEIEESKDTQLQKAIEYLKK